MLLFFNVIIFRILNQEYMKPDLILMLILFNSYDTFLLYFKKITFAEIRQVYQSPKGS